MSDLIFVDVETTGLDPNRHCVWEMAYAYEQGPVESSVVPHSIVSAEPKALEIGQYDKRSKQTGDVPGEVFEMTFASRLAGNTLVAANPAFDASFLAARWGGAVWHYRLLDVEAYAMGILGWDRPKGLREIAAELRADGIDIPKPDHSAGKDVEVLRACFLALRDRRDQSVSVNLLSVFGDNEYPHEALEQAMDDLRRSGFPPSSRLADDIERQIPTEATR